MCGETKPETDFAVADMAKGTRQRHCRTCQAAYRRAHYLANRDAYIALEVARMAGYRDANRALLLAYLLEHPCVDCGVGDPVLLDFDHRDPSTKRSEVARLASRKSWPQVLAEIQKCDVRCANCHRRKTAKQLGWAKLLRSVTEFANLIEQPFSFDWKTPTWRHEPLSERASVVHAAWPSQSASSRSRTGNAERDRRNAGPVRPRIHANTIDATGRLTWSAPPNSGSSTARSAVSRAYNYLTAHPCVDCGESDPIVLEFDHRDPSKKRASISKLISHVTWAALQREIAQCDVRCANCHRRRTAEQFGWAKLQEHSA
jgi:hypothetical protein